MPSAFARVSVPSSATAYEVIVLLFVFVTKACLAATTTQQGADCVEVTELLATLSAASPAIAYELAAPLPSAPPNASDTMSCPFAPNAKPKGVMPAEGCTLG